jgi:hypothetical protein
MAGIPNVALSIPCFITVEVIEGLLAALRHRSSITVVGIEAVVHMAVKAVVAVEPWTSSNEDAADKPVGPVVAVGRAVIRGIVEVSIGASGFNTDVDGDLGRPDRCTAEQRNCES